MMIKTISMPVMRTHWSKHREMKSRIIDCVNNVEQAAITEEGTQISSSDYLLNPGVEKPYISVLGTDFFDTLDQLFAGIDHGRWQITSTWTQSYKTTGDCHGWHRHHCCLWSCVYMLELTQTAPRTQMRDMITGAQWQLDAEEGDILVWPSQIMHSSPSIGPGDRKTIIGFNIDAL